MSIRQHEHHLRAQAGVLLLAFLVLWPGVAPALAREGPATASSPAFPSAADASALVQQAQSHGLFDQLNSDGCQVVPEALVRTNDAEGSSILGFAIESGGWLKRTDPTDVTWSESIPFLAGIGMRDQKVEYVSETRFEPRTGRLLHEMRMAPLPDMRLRVIERIAGPANASPEIQVWGRLPDGSFDQVVETTSGQLTFAHHPGDPLPQVFVRNGGRGWRCFKNCVIDLNIKISWGQAIGIAACIATCGLAAVAGAGPAAAAAIKPCLLIVGCGHLLIRIASVVACAIKCFL